MLRKERKFEELCRALLGSGPENGQSFEDICRSVRACPADMDEFLWDEFGMDGEEILQYLANGMKFC